MNIQLEPLPDYASKVAEFLYNTYKDGKFDVLENLEYTCIDNKHLGYELCFKGDWYYPVTSLRDENLCATWGETKAMAPYFKWLGERISLCLNINKGKSNEELRQIYESNQGTMA